MTEYLLEIKTPEKDLARVMRALHGVYVKVSVQEDTKSFEMTFPAEAPPPRVKRGSKVADTIVAKLQGGPLKAIELQAALVEAGLAKGSLSTGLANLQKDGVITKRGDGVYALAA